MTLVFAVDVHAVSLGGDGAFNLGTHSVITDPSEAER